MSLTIEVRNMDGTATGTVTSVGQVLNLEVVAVINSGSFQPSNYGLLYAQGSFLSTALGGHSVAGNLAATNLLPFAATGATPGRRQDLNGDGNLDVGSNAGSKASTDYFRAQGSSMQGSDVGTIVGNALTFDIATLAYTVTALNKGGSTQINFAPYVNPLSLTAVWTENAFGGNENTAIGTFAAGTPYTVSDPALITAPAAVNDSATVAINTATAINELGNDVVIEPLNLASVSVTVAAGHGTTSLQSNGSILYTPANGYVGSDSFTYTVADTDGRVSNPAVVNITVVSTPAPTAGPVSATTFLDQPVDVNVLSQASSVATLVPSSVTVISAPAHGTAITQPDGSILYTPFTGYLGTDAFNYTVGDSNGETSASARVTLTVNRPVSPTANNDTFFVITGTPTTLNVMANDVLGSLAAGTTVQITSNASNGTLVMQSDQTVLYTPAAGYTGSDSFKYDLVDSLGDASALATVTLTIGTPTTPTAGDVTAPALSGQTNSINVLSNVSGGAAIVPGSVKIVTAPADGNATANTDGSISYHPVAGFIGTDTFTYTATDTNGFTSAPGTVSVEVGTSISNAKGAAHSLTFTDAAGGGETVALSRGSAEIFFSGTGTLTLAKNGKATVTGSGLELGSIALTGTTKASSFSIKGSAKTPVTLGGITDTAPLGSISALSANVTGNITLNSAGSMSVGSIANATIAISAGLPGKFALTSGAIRNSSLNCAVPITMLRSGSWAGSGTISAPSINTMTIKSGGLAASISTGVLGSLSVGESLTGNITATSAKSIKVSAALSATIATTGNIGSISAASLAASTITAGVTAGTTFATAAIANLGGATIGSVRVLGKGSCAATDILAGKITAASLGIVTTGNGGTAFGIATKSLAGFSGTFANSPLHLNHRQLQNEQVLQAYLNQKGVSFGDFSIALNG